MNIFVLDYDIQKCAQYHVDKHVVKMILESAQMLSTAVRSTGIDAGYKATHVNHPCNVWLRESIFNYTWLFELLLELHKEWKYRYNHPPTKLHKSFEVVQSLPVPDLPKVDMTPFKLCMPDEFKTNDVVESYRAYYLKDKAHLLSWKKRGKPEWA